MFVLTIAVPNQSRTEVHLVIFHYFVTLKLRNTCHFSNVVELSSFLASFLTVNLEISHNNFQVEIQNQNLGVQASVISASIFPQTAAAKEGSISSLSD